MTSFFTRTGDDGYTGLLGEGRVPKNHPRLEAVGALDEATAALGLARAACQSPVTAPLLLTVQRDLYHLMAEVAATFENAARFRMIDAEKISWLENITQDLEAKVNIPKEFIVPGDTTAGAAMALARTIVRRAERHVAGLVHNGDLENIELVRYLNRLSSLLFVLELIENNTSGNPNPTLAKG